MLEAHAAAGRVLGAPPPEVIDELVDRINRAERVAIFGGIGCAGARARTAAACWHCATCELSAPATRASVLVNWLL